MAVLDIRTFPDPVLRRKAVPVEEINGEIRKLIEDMIDTMRDAPGIGFAAPQVGISKRVIVVDISVGDDPQSLHVLINPEIVEAEGSEVAEEGCLSMPGVKGEVERAQWIRVKALDRDGKEVSLEADSLLARVIQHEVDHLDGYLYWDRMSRKERDLVKENYRKQEAETSDSRPLII